MTEQPSRDDDTVTLGVQSDRSRTKRTGGAGHDRG